MTTLTEAVPAPDLINLMREAEDWRLVSLLLTCPCPGWKTELQFLGEECTAEDLKQAVTNALNEADEGLYHSIFGPGGPAPPREVSYQHWAQPGLLLSEVTSYYQAFSFQPKEGEVLDHIAVEAGFIGFLRLKEAYARASELMEQAALTAEAARSFLTDHLAVIARPLAKNLAGSGVAYLETTAQALNRLTAAYESKAGKIGLSLPVLEDESNFECGGQEPE